MRKRKLVVMAVSLSLVVWCLVSVAFRQIASFKQEEWIANPSARSKMLSSLLKETKFQGQKKKRAVALLGAPDFENSKMLVYQVPTETSKGVFVLFIDSNGVIRGTTYDDSDHSEFYKE